MFSPEEYKKAGEEFWKIVKKLDARDKNYPNRQQLKKTLGIAKDAASLLSEKHPELYGRHVEAVSAIERDLYRLKKPVSELNPNYVSLARIACKIASNFVKT